MREVHIGREGGREGERKRERERREGGRGEEEVEYHGTVWRYVVKPSKNTRIDTLSTLHMPYGISPIIMDFHGYSFR